ncbi:hypothetical protein LT493_00440 [Streptomyces tricolor]|nr:hypothetical protein [Streptomyces tricolor]
MFDHPNPAALADHPLRALLPGESEEATADRIIAELARVDSALGGLPADGADRAWVAPRTCGTWRPAGTRRRPAGNPSGPRWTASPPTNSST